MPSEAFDEKQEPTHLAAADGRRPVVERGVLQADPAEVQRQRVQSVLQHVDGERAANVGLLPAGHDRVVGGNNHRLPRGAALGRLPGLLHQVVVFLAAQQDPFRLLLQENVQVGERHVDFAWGPLGLRRRRLAGRGGRNRAADRQ